MYGIYEQIAGQSPKLIASFESKKEAKQELSRMARVEATERDCIFYYNSQTKAKTMEDSPELAESLCNVKEAGYYDTSILPFELWLSEAKLQAGLESYQYDNKQYFVKKK